MDRYVLAKTAELVDEVTALMDAYDVPDACHAVESYLDLLTNWYVRTQRDRFWEEDADAFDTLFTVLETLCRVAAPLAPLVTEEVWRGLTGGRSVHLTDWPVAPAAWRNAPLGAVMDTVREVVSAAHALRKRAQIRVRQPLQSLEVAVPDPNSLKSYVAMIATELNVRFVVVVSPEAFASANPVERRLTVNARAAGPRIGGDVQRAIAGAKSGDWTVDSTAGPGGAVIAGGIALEPGEYELDTVIGAGDVVASVLPSGGFVLLDTTLTPELEAEGFARDVIRLVQDERKNAGLDVSDRIRLTLTVPEERLGAIQAHLALISRETLAYDPGNPATPLIDVSAGKDVAVAVAKI